MKPSFKLITMVACALLLTGCGGNQSALDVHGASAVHLKHLIVGIVAVCSAIWMIVMIVLIWALSRSKADWPRPNPEGERRLTTAVTAAVGMTVIIITGLTIASFTTTRALSEAKPGDLTIRINGQQWWWQITYIDPDPARSFDTANEIHVPVGRNVRLQLEAGDVIHSFWVPSLAGKQDLIPGRVNELTIRADRAGVYRGQCAEFCGLQHSHMAVLVIAESAADYEDWMSAQRQQAAASSNQEAEAGKAVFMSKPCASCHTVRGTDASGTTGPDLTHVGSRQMIAAGLFDTTRGSLAAWIADPQTLKPGNNMPTVALSSDELRQVSAYMASLK
jgi:cytochrome c oxidase subunit II